MEEIWTLDVLYYNINELLLKFSRSKKLVLWLRI